MEPAAPRFFLDRSLGDRFVVDRLRECGWDVVGMRERYGNLTAQQLADVDWIAEAVDAGDILLTGDKRIARRPLEKLAVVRAGARMFALSNNSVTGPQRAERFLQHEAGIMRRCASVPGPFIYRVTGTSLVRVDLSD